MEKLICGIDECGRGAGAGPVVAGAVIFKNGYHNPQIRDSKKLSSNKRVELARDIRANSFCAIGWASVEEIEKFNILQATYLAMHRAVLKLPKTPTFLMVDGNQFKPFQDIPFECIIKGDDKVEVIGAASIIAKVTRDLWMQKVHHQFDKWDWYNNKGYLTKKHREAIKEYGICELHRPSFLNSILEGN